jgi:hypothetical protein
MSAQLHAPATFPAGWTKGWVGLRAGLHAAVAKRNFTAGIEPRSSRPQHGHYNDWTVEIQLIKRLQASNRAACLGLTHRWYGDSSEMVKMWNRIGNGFCYKLGAVR